MASAVAVFVTSPLHAESGTGPSLRLWPGVGLGFASVSLEVIVDAPRWYFGGEFAAALVPGHLETAEFGGVRGGVYLGDAPTAAFVGLGGGLLTLDFPGIATGFGPPVGASSNGWGVSAEVGVAFFRDRSWLRPQLVLEAIRPVAQNNSSLGRPLIFTAGARLFL